MVVMEWEYIAGLISCDDLYHSFVLFSKFKTKPLAPRALFTNRKGITQTLTREREKESLKSQFTNGK